MSIELTLEYYKYLDSIKNTIGSLEHINPRNLLNNLKKYKSVLTYSVDLYVLYSILSHIVNHVYQEENYIIFHNKLEKLLYTLYQDHAPVYTLSCIYKYILNYSVYHNYTSYAYTLLKQDNTIVNKTDRTTDFARYLPITVAIYNKNVEMIKLLIKHGADINQQDNLGRTDLHVLYISLNDNMLDVLLSNEYVQINPHIKDYHGRDVLNSHPIYPFGLTEEKKIICVKRIQKYIDEEYDILDIKNALD